MLGVCALLLTGFGTAETQVITGQTMGTSYRIVVSEQYGLPDLAPIETEITQKLEALENQMSTWRPDSELSRFNASDSTDWFSVSADTVHVVSEAKRFWKISEGAFDPTVAPLIKLWHFAEEPGEPALPSDSTIEQARSRTGFDQIEVRTEPPALRKLKSELQLNLSAIAKGYAVDVISDLLAERDCANHLVEIGGEMRSRGRKYDGSSWRAGIEKPDAVPRKLYASLALDNRAIATSGDYRNYFEVDGKRYSHTIDPTTGRPVVHNLASVSVLAEDCLTADAVATAIEVLGPDRGLQFAEQHGIPALLVIRQADGFQSRITDSFQAVMDSPEPPADSPESSPVMVTVLAVIGLFALAITGMAVGVIFSNRCIQGSCGGLANMPGNEGKSPCELCSVPADQCRDETMRKLKQQAESANDACEA